MPSTMVRIVASARASHVPVGMARAGGVEEIAGTADASVSTVVVDRNCGSATATAAAPLDIGAGAGTADAAASARLLGARAGAVGFGSTKYIAQMTRR